MLSKLTTLALYDIAPYKLLLKLQIIYENKKHRKIERIIWKTFSFCPFFVELILLLDNLSSIILRIAYIW